MPKIHLSQDLWDVIYPVGSLYFTVVDDTAQKVHDRFGGNWELFGAGRTPVCVDTNDSDFNTVEKTGGGKATYLPMQNTDGYTFHDFQWLPFTDVRADWKKNVWENYRFDGINHDWLPSSENATSGGMGVANEVSNSAANSNLQPYKTCYIWKRVAD